MLGTLLLTMALVAVADQPVLEAERLYARGVAAGAAFHLEEAEQSFREALATDSLHIPSKRALDVIDGLALELLSRESAILIFEGLAAQDRKDWAAARDRYAKATRASPGYGLAFHNLGVSLYELGDTPAAIASYHKALQWNPDYPYTHNNLGLAYARLGKHEEACKSYQTALDLDPEYYKAYNNFGTSLRQLGREDEATVAFRKALEINPRYSVADGNLAHDGTLREAISPESDAPAALTLVGRLGSESYEERGDALREDSTERRPFCRSRSPSSARERAVSRPPQFPACARSLEGPQSPRPRARVAAQRSRLGRAFRCRHSAGLAWR